MTVDILPVLNKQVAQYPITIRNPNGSTMRSTHLAELPIPHLPMAARRAHIVPELRSHSLLSIGTLCDAGCEVKLTTTTVTVIHNDATIMTGTRIPPGLWQFRIPSPPSTESEANSTIGYPNAAELVAYSHAALFSPALSTLEKPSSTDTYETSPVNRQDITTSST